MNKRIVTLALVGVMALGSTAAVYAATNNSVHVSPTTSSKAVTVEQQKEQVKENEQLKENDEQELNASNTKTAITEEQAKQTALVSIKDGVFKSIELEDEDGVIVYGVEIQTGTNTYDVKVDANTGSIVKTDQGNDEQEEGNIEKESKAGDNDNVEHENQNEDPAGYED